MSKRMPLDAAMEMFELGVAMREQRFRRDHPEATESDVKAMMVTWMRWRPGAEDGDAQGRAIEPQHRARMLSTERYAPSSPTFDHSTLDSRSSEG